MIREVVVLQVEEVQEVSLVQEGLQVCQGKRVSVEIKEREALMA